MNSPCDSHLVTVKQLDGSVIRVCQQLSGVESATVTISVYVLAAGFSEWKTLLVKEIDGSREAGYIKDSKDDAESEPLMVELTDFNSDGFSEIIIRDSLHVGLVNTPVYFYVFNQETMSMDHLGDFAADEIAYIHGSLVVGARTGCCARGFSVFDWAPGKLPLPDGFRIEVWSHGGDDRDAETTTFCRFSREDKIVPPPDKFWLRYCEVFAESYQLISADVASEESSDLLDAPTVVADEPDFSR